MKKCVLNLILLLLSVMCAYSQTQQGIVKTKGRLGKDGKVIAGKPLQGASIVVKGRTAVVSGTNGNFSFPIPGQNFYLQNVKKQGYLLTDPDILSKQYSYSKANPLYIVMETPDMQTADKLNTERKIRRTLQNKLRLLEDEIDKLKEENKISEKEYQQRLQRLYEQQEMNEKLISEMAERYSKIDYDQLDEYNLRISEFILNGELSKADSMINSKGDINTRVSEFKRHQQINAEEEKELAQRQENLTKSKAYTQKELEDLAQDCYNKYEIFKMNFQNDSAAYYLEVRANLDTMNVEWQLEAGIFISDYLANYERSLSYYQKALSNAVKQYGENHSDVATSYNNIGGIYNEEGDYDKAFEYYTKSLNIRLKIFDENHPNVATSYNNIAGIYDTKGDYDKALEYYAKSLNIRLKIFDENHPSVATNYSNLGVTYVEKEDYDTALEYLTQALNIRLKIFDENHPDIATSYNNIGGIISAKGDYDKALEFYTKA